MAAGTMNADGSRNGTSWPLLCGVAVVWVTVAWLVYRPTSPHPFDVLDFSEFLPLLRNADSFGDRFLAFVHYYAYRGRVNLGSYFVLILNYQLWGGDAVGWQLTRMLQLAAASALLFALLRRWGANVPGATAGCFLPICARSAAPTWTRFTSSEPLGLLVVLVMLWLATGFPAVVRPRRRIIAISVLVVFLIALKEVFVAILPAIWGVSLLTDRDGRWRWQRPTKDHRELVATTSLVAAVCLVPVLLVALKAPTDSYASLYGVGVVGFGYALVDYLSILIPFVPVTAELNPGVLLSDVALLLLLAVGWRQFHDQSAARGSQSRLVLLFALLVPTLGVISYLPWPNFQDFYGLPYLIGTAILVAFAITGVAQTGRTTILALSLWGVPLLFMLTSANQSASRTYAGLAMSHEVTRIVSAEASSDTVVFAVRYIPLRTWFGLGATLARQAAADGKRFPAVVDLQCIDAMKRLQQPSRAVPVVVLHSQCQPLEKPQRWVSRRFLWFDWRRGRIVEDSARADLFNLN